MHDSIMNESSYSPVRYKKQNGMLLLTLKGLFFSTTNGNNPSNRSSNSGNNTTTASWAWNQIAKHQVSPANYPKSLLKLVFNNNGSGSVSFQLSSRPELDRIRKDITLRLQNTAQTLAVPLSSGSSPSLPVSSSNVGSTTSNKRRKSAAASLGTTGYYGKDLDPTALAVTRSTLLAASKPLRLQHTQMVQTNIMDEEDFWDTHGDLIQEEYARIAGIRQAGTSSLLQSHLVTGSGGGGGGKVQLGVEEMRQIFILYPAVHQAYEEKVPLELSDEQFWRKYLESEYFHRDRGRRGAMASNTNNTDGKDNNNGSKLSSEQEQARAAAVGTDDLFSRYDQKLREAQSSATNAMGVGGSVGTSPPKRKVMGRNLALGQFDLASTLATERSHVNQGVRDNHPENAGDDDNNTNSSRGARVIGKYNRHWAMVLHPDQAVAGTDLLKVAQRSVLDGNTTSSATRGNDEHKMLDADYQAGGGLDAEARQLVAFCDADPGTANHAAGRGPDDLDYEPLTLANVEVYYQAAGNSGGASSGDNAPSTEEDRRKQRVLCQLVQQRTAKLVEDLNANPGSLPDSCFPPPALGRDLLMALTRKMVQDSQTESASMNQLVKELPSDFCQQLQSYTTRSSELLRHFFGLRRLQDDASQQQSAVKAKLQRIVQAMERLYREMETMREELPEMKQRETMRKMLFLTVMDQLNWAFQLHRDGSGGGGGFVAVDEG